MTNLVEFPAGGALTQRVAEEVRALKARRRVKQADLAAVLHVSQPQVSMRLNGRVEFTLSDVEALARYFGVTPAELLGEHHIHSPDGGGVTSRYPAILAAA